MKVICGWCRATLKDGPLPISHGLCAACAARLHAELDADDARHTALRPATPTSERSMRRWR